MLNYSFEKAVVVVGEVIFEKGKKVEVIVVKVEEKGDKKWVVDYIVCFDC